MKHSARHSIREFVEKLGVGTRVVWIPNGSLGTVQPDHTILWDDGHHMTKNQMSDTHILLIHTEAERKRVTEALENRLRCLKQGCTLLRWHAADCKEQTPEELCPLAILGEPDVQIDMPRRRRTLRPVTQPDFERFDFEQNKRSA